MRYFAISLAFATCLLLVQLPYAYAQGPSAGSWNQFRGPDRIGAMEYDLPDEFPNSGPELLWKKPVGSAFSELAIVGDRVYTMFSEAVDTTSGTEFLAAYDAKTGDELWRVKTDSLFFDQFGNGPRSTPLVDGDKVYCLSSHGKLSAHNAADGSLVWQTDLVKEFGSTLPRWGFSTSPVLVGDILVLEAGGTESRGFVGIDRNTGIAVWTRGEGVAYYTSPVVVTIDGKEQILFASQTTLFSFDAGGDTLWTCPISMNGPMASPVVMDDNRIFISTVRSRGFCVVEVKDGKPKEVLTGSTMKNDFSSSVYHDGYIYGFDVAALQCISAATGEKKWTKRGFGKGSLIRVGDQLLVLSDKGMLIRVKAVAEAYTELGSYQALEGKSWTAPSFSDGKLYLRNLTEMACYKFN
jgi:outer membrane protein assembly factor BamB